MRQEGKEEVLNFFGASIHSFVSVPLLSSEPVQFLLFFGRSSHKQQDWSLSQSSVTIIHTLQGPSSE